MPTFVISKYVRYEIMAWGMSVVRVLRGLVLSDHRPATAEQRGLGHRIREEESPQDASERRALLVHLVKPARVMETCQEYSFSAHPVLFLLVLLRCQHYELLDLGQLSFLVSDLQFEVRECSVGESSFFL